MTTLALALVLASAVAHATWNLLAKRAGGSGSVAFIWLFSALASLFFAPAALFIFVTQHTRFSVLQVLFLLGSSLLHIGYFMLLQRGYRAGDLSLVYPLARGTGPMLSTAAAIAFLGERPTPLALCGAVLIGLSVFFLAGGPQQLRRPELRHAIGYALLTGLFIASYTLWDKHAVSALAVAPLLLDWCSNVARTAILLPLAMRRWPQVRETWTAHRVEAAGVAILSPLSYILVLAAMTFTPVSYVAPAREISILIGTVLGGRVLEENDARRRQLVAVVMVLGVVFLAIG